MADELAGVLTDLGAYLIEQAYQAGEVVQITEMALGDGGGSEVVVSPDVTQLVGEFHRQLLDGGPDEASALGGSINFSPLPEDAGKWLREFGLFDSLGNLIVYAAYSPTQLPENPNMAVQFIISLMVPIMNIEAIEIVVNPEGTVTNDQLLEHEQSRRHPAAAEGAQGMIPLATPAMVAEGTDHTSALTPKTANETFAKLQHEHEIDDILFLGQELDSKQPLDALLTALAALVTTPDKLAYFTGADTVALATLTAFARSLLGDANAAAALTTLGVSTFIQGLLNDADAATALDTLGAVAKATPTMTGDLHISKDSGGLIALDHAPGQIAYTYGHDGTKRTFFLGVADTDGTVQISNADGVYLNLYPTHAAFSHDLHVTGGESPNSAVRLAYADALSYDGSGNTVDVGFSAMMVGNGWTLNETVAGSAVTLAYLEANDISAEAFLGGATSSALRVGTWKARHGIGSTGKQIAVPGERIL